MCRIAFWLLASLNHAFAVENDELSRHTCAR